MDDLEQKVTIDTILDWCKEQVEKKVPIPPSMWLDSAFKLDALMQDLDEELVQAEMAYNQKIAQAVILGQSATAAKLVAKGSDEYGHYLRLTAKKERVLQFIQIAKKRTEAKL